MVDLYTLGWLAVGAVFAYKIYQIETAKVYLHSDTGQYETPKTVHADPFIIQADDEEINERMAETLNHEGPYNF